MILIGPSGYNYTEWKGSFYPTDLPTSKMLPYYSERFPTVEINYSFYRMPSEQALRGWVTETPPGFRFTLKAPRRITHDARLHQCEDTLQTFGNRARILGPKLGTLLFQLPPSFKKNLDGLEEFLDWVPPDLQIALEFRNSSWHSEDVFSRLKDKNVAPCIADSERMTTPIVATASYGYFRLRDEGYQEHESDWTDVFVCFKHEEEGKGPIFAKSLHQHLEQRSGTG